MTEFKLDRNIFQMGSHQKPDVVDWKKKSYAERLNIAAYLNSVAYNYPMHSPPKLDRTTFHMKKRK